MKIIGYILLGGALVTIVYLVVEHIKQPEKESKKLTAKQMMDKKQFTPEDAQNGLLEIQKQYGTGMAKLIEKITRLETAHYTSGQYKLTGSAGMEAGKWQGLPSNIKTVDITDNHDGHLGHFIVWDSVTDFMNYLVGYIQRHKGNFANWNSDDPAKQLTYAKEVNSIKTHYIS